MLTYSFSRKDKRPLYQRLYECIKEDILSGKIHAEEKLPSKRSLARHMEISVITVENAYAQLIVEGYVHAEEKRGYFVSRLEERLMASGERNRLMPKEKTGESYKIDFTANSPSPDNFPFSVWSKVMRRILAEKKTELLMRMPYEGVPALRKAIAEYLFEFRGMAVSPRQIIVGAGTEYLYSLIIQLLGREKSYGVEDPGYEKIGRIYESQGVSCKYIPLDDQGLSLEHLKDSQVQVVHISPAHHFPTGRVMPIRRRQELLSWAKEEEGRYIIEDDYDSEFRFTGRPIPTLESIDRGERVIYMNTFSKTIAPSIRISYMVLPPSLTEQFARQLSFYSCTVPSFEQYTLAEFISQGYFEQHINRMRNYYRGLRDGLIQAIRSSSLREKVRILEEDAGLHFLLEIHTEIQDSLLRQRAKEEGVRLSWLREYYHELSGQGKTTAVINYSGIAREDIPQVVEALEKILAQ